jgi:Na+-translocating ferredoxin:NAD+ oxidoreductase RnfG subunit
MHEESGNLSEELKTLKNIESKINELLKWTKFAGMQQLKSILTQALGNDDAAALAYEFSNGARGTREVAKLAGIKSHNTVAVYWRKWNKLGIVEPSRTYQGKFQRICSLEEVGLTVPSVPQASGPAQEEAEPEVEENE